MQFGLKWAFTGTNSCLALLWFLLAACQQTDREAEGMHTAAQGIEDCTPFTALNTNSDGLTRDTLHAEPFSGRACTYHKNSALHTLTAFVVGVREGRWEVYYPNGQLHKQGAINGGQEDGPYLEYFPHGQLKYEYHYERGERVGVWKSWYADGTPYTERHFAQGVIHGKVWVWDEQGRLAKEYDYRNGSVVRSQMHFEDFD